MIDSLERNGDFVQLGSSDDYAAYFQHLNRVFAFLLTWYQKLVRGGDTEAKIVQGFLENFLHTVRALRFKHLYAGDDHPLILDLNDSGFPQWLGISELEADVALRDERLARLPGRRIVMEMMLDEMLGHGQEPAGVLPHMAEIQFIE